MLNSNHTFAESIKDAENLLSKLKKLKKNDLLHHKDEIAKILLDELAEKYYGSREKIRYGFKFDRQLQEAYEILQNRIEYKKILAIN